MPTLTYLSRICWNSEGWRWPTDEAARLESEHSFVSINGFGHEEWLLNSAWQVDNWRYGFLQPVNNARPSRVSNTMNILLYTISPAKDRLYVGRINACERINSNSTSTTYGAFSGLTLNILRYISACRLLIYSKLIE